MGSRDTFHPRISYSTIASLAKLRVEASESKSLIDSLAECEVYIPILPVMPLLAIMAA